MTDAPVLKWRPEDFLVSEAAAALISPHRPGGHQHLRLRKIGRSTFDAVAEVARFAAIDRSAVTYAGLKDEDAVTEQNIRINIAAGGRYPVEEFNSTYSGDSACLHLTDCGSADRPLTIGQLDGNSFRIVIRNLEGDVADALGGRRHNHFFVNYFDTQRFGVPGGPKVTHIIGARLLEHDYDSALALVATSQASESEAARSWRGDPAGFFDSIDQRLRTFYLSAHASEHWNNQAGVLIEQHGAAVQVYRDGIPYEFAKSWETVVRMALATPELTNTKYRAGEEGVVASSSTRCTAVQTQVTAGLAEPDEAFAGRSKCEVTMFLPSGSYATTAIAQLLARIAARKNPDPPDLSCCGA
jgi:tRNA pseudouridine13 synthase